MAILGGGGGEHCSITIAESKPFETTHTSTPATTVENLVFNNPSQARKPEGNSQNATRFLLASLALLALEGIFPDREWPGWALPVTSSRTITACFPVVTLQVRCRVIPRTATVRRCLRALVQPWTSRDVVVSCPSCWRDRLLRKLFCSAGREAGQRKIGYLCINLKQISFGGSGKEAKLLVTEPRY